MPSPGVLELVTAPASEPVTVAEAKAHARVEHSADDTLIGTYISGARGLVEKLTGRALITQTWKLTLDAWPGSTQDDGWSGIREAPISQVQGEFIDIRKAKFAAITHVKTYDESDTATTWDASNYYVTKTVRGAFGRLVRKQASTWPDISTRSVGAIVITFTAGYGALAADVPVELRQAIKDIVAHWYENRETAADVGSGYSAAPLKTQALIQQFMVPR